MISYKRICEKLGFDPITDKLQFPTAGHEDDRWVSPFGKLTDEELEFLADCLIENRDKLSKYVIQ